MNIKQLKKRFFALFNPPKNQQKNTVAHNIAVPFNTGTHVSIETLISLQEQGRKLDLSHRSAALASTVGPHASRFRGRGMDYQESRIYQAGDDIRSMDWRVTARAGKPHTKLYQEERERPIVLFVDFNPSMFFGSSSALKSVIAAKTAALLAWAASQQGDKVGGLLFNGEHHELPPKMGKRGVLQFIRQLVHYADPQRALNNTHHVIRLNDELKRLRRLARPGSLVFLISDFYAIDAQTSKHLRRIRRHSDIIALQIVDPLEITVPPAGRYGVTNSMSNSSSSSSTEQGILDIQSRKGREQYKQFFTQHHQAVARLMRQHTIPLLQISTNDDVAKCLQRAFSLSKRASVNERKDL
ncbi:MAG TPA: DUF58 domain-containing protein [Thiothrix sp.]|nr:DUF58 domain-containing protein [Thiothrix sp.]